VGEGSTNSVEDTGQIERGCGGGSPAVRVHLNLKIGETHILIRLLRIIIHGTGNSAQLCQKFVISGGGEELNPPNPPRYATV
jgi:hypothetical protein